MLKMLKTATISLALLLAALFPAALLAMEPAKEFPAAWGCLKQGGIDLLCLSTCQYYDGSRDFRQVTWRCPNSDYRTRCTSRPCRTPEECRMYRLPYIPCHDVEAHVCQARAVRATQFACKVKGPLGTAFNVGGCVLRIRKNLQGNWLELRNDCWNPSDFAFAPDWWTPIHPETLVRFPPPLPKR